MNKEQLDKQLNTGELLIWQANRIKELEDALGAIYEVFPRGVQDRFVDDLIENTRLRQ